MRCLLKRLSLSGGPSSYSYHSTTTATTTTEHIHIIPFNNSLFTLLYLEKRSFSSATLSKPTGRIFSLQIDVLRMVTDVASSHSQVISSEANQLGAAIFEGGGNKGVQDSLGRLRVYTDELAWVQGAVPPTDWSMVRSLLVWAKIGGCSEQLRGLGVGLAVGFEGRVRIYFSMGDSVAPLTATGGV